MAMKQTIETSLGGLAEELVDTLRNPLNVVKTSVYYLLHAEHLSAEKKAEHLQRIERQVGIADRVIAALADFVGLPAPAIRPVDVSACLREALNGNLLPENVTISLDCPSGLPPVMGDARQLSLAFANLIRNACDTMPNGGTVSISVCRAGDCVDVEFADKGSGSRRGNRGRIAGPPLATKHRGIGLGLAISRAILDKHDAELRVQGEEGQGSVFFVRLGQAQDAAA
jgi:signal transduction histidine kinase